MRSVKASDDQCEAYARPQCCILDGIFAWFLEFRFSVLSGLGTAAESALGSDQIGKRMAAFDPTKPFSLWEKLALVLAVQQTMTEELAQS